ncbi:MAG: outer membrane lipoprotein carrier protein LolA [Myxococcota bacterium]
MSLNPFTAAYAPVAVACIFVGSAGVAHAAGPADAAADESVTQVVTAVEAQYAAVRSIQANFTQIKTDSFGEMKQGGDVVVDRPNRMRWRFTSGDESVFATDGKTLTLYNKASDYYQQMPDNTADNATAQGFLTSLDTLDEVFAVSLVDGTSLAGAGPTLDLVPHTPGALSKIRLDLSSELMLERLTLTDTYGNVTDIHFADVVLNGPVDASIFNFPHPTVEVDR